MQTAIVLTTRRSSTGGCLIYDDTCLTYVCLKKATFNAGSYGMSHDDTWVDHMHSIVYHASCAILTHAVHRSIAVLTQAVLHSIGVRTYTWHIIHRSYHTSIAYDTSTAYHTSIACHTSIYRSIAVLTHAMLHSIGVYVSSIISHTSIAYDIPIASHVSISRPHSHVNNFDILFTSFSPSGNRKLEVLNVLLSMYSTYESHTHHTVTHRPLGTRAKT